jgi:hypothetical protein
MHIPPPLRPANWRRHLVAFAMLALLPACGTNNGDFGEVRGTYLRDDMHDWVAYGAYGGQKIPPSNFRLTDDERQLRDLAYPLIEAPYDRQQWYSAFGEYNEVTSDPRGLYVRAEYANRLLTSRFRSPAAQYARLTDDIRDDITRLPQFFETAARVIDIDEKRRASLSFVSDSSPQERDNALRRMRENSSLVALVRTKLDQRVASYRYALERLVVMTPSAQAVDVERSVNQLQAQIAYYRTHSAPTWAREQSLAAAR